MSKRSIGTAGVYTSKATPGTTAAQSPPLSRGARSSPAPTVTSGSLNAALQHTRVGVLLGDCGPQVVRGNRSLGACGR